MIPLMKQINITYRCGVMYRDKQLASLGLNGCQTPYFTALYRSPGISQEDLARQLNVNKSSVARQLAALESLGYVRREVSPEDRRALLAYPTDKALAIREQVMHVLHAWREYLLQGFTQEEQTVLSGLLTRVAERAEAYVKGGDGACDSSSTI